MKRIKKVCVATWFPLEPGSPRGGVEVVSCNLVKALARAGVEIDVITFTRKIDTAFESQWQGVRIHYLPMRSASLAFFSVFRGRKILSHYIRQISPDIVHAHDTYGIMTSSLAIPRVFTVHGFIHEDTRYQRSLTSRVRSRVWKFIEVRGWKSQSHIISIAPYVREKLEPVVHCAVYDISNPVDETFFAITRDVAQPAIFCAAVINRRKNIYGLVKAFDKISGRIPAACLRIAGPVEDAQYFQTIQDIVKRRNLGANVFFLGALSSTAIRDELSRASVFALVSFEEGAPMGIAEAHAAGVPVIASNRCGMPSMITNGEDGLLVNPDDTEEIGQALKALCEDEGMNRRMSQAARRRALKVYHPDAIAQKTIEVYSDAAQFRSK
jgi:glycosyltransferase involved in cell wall biosynthesis